eukprot:893647-Amphidinium_carterae.1
MSNHHTTNDVLGADEELELKRDTTYTPERHGMNELSVTMQMILLLLHLKFPTDMKHFHTDDERKFLTQLPTTCLEQLLFHSYAKPIGLECHFSSIATPKTRHLSGTFIQEGERENESPTETINQTANLTLWKVIGTRCSTVTCRGRKRTMEFEFPPGLRPFNKGPLFEHSASASAATRGRFEEGEVEKGEKNWPTTSVEGVFQRGMADLADKLAANVSKRVDASMNALENWASTTENRIVSKGVDEARVCSCLGSSHSQGVLRSR